MKIIAAAAWCSTFGTIVSPFLIQTTLVVPRRAQKSVFPESADRRNALSVLFAEYGSTSAGVDPYAGLMNKVDSSVKGVTDNVPAIMEQVPEKAEDASMKVLDDVSKSVADAVATTTTPGGASALNWFGRNGVEGSGTATQQTLEEVSKAAAEASAAATAAATAAAQSMTSSLDGTIKSAVSRSVPGMKVKAGGVVAAGTAPTLPQFLSGQRQAAGENLAVNNIMEKLSIMKSNLMNMELTAGFDPDALAGGDASRIASSFNVNNLLDLFRVKEYGAWYLVVVAVVIAIGQKNVGEEEARRLLEQDLKLAEEKAAAAIEEAKKAAEEARKTKKGAGNSKTTNDDSSAAELKKVLSEQESLKKELEDAKAEAKKLRDELKTVLSEQANSSSTSESDVTTREAPIMNGTIEPPSKASGKPAAKKSPAKKKQPAIATEAAVEATSPEASTATVEQKTKKAAPKKSKTATSAKKETSNVAGQWAKLSESSLKRKTVAELSGFLEDQGIKATAENGKALMKKDLVAKVQELIR